MGIGASFNLAAITYERSSFNIENENVIFENTVSLRSVHSLEILKNYFSFRIRSVVFVHSDSNDSLKSIHKESLRASITAKK